MSVLTDAWVVRVSTRMANQLTNPDDGKPQSVNAARLAAADADVKAEFSARTGTTLDETNARHILVGVRGITLILLTWKGMPFEVLRQEKEQWFKELDAAAGIDDGGKTWVPPTTDSPLQQSQPGNAVIRPLGDDENFQRLVPNRPKTDGGRLDYGDF